MHNERWFVSVETRIIDKKDWLTTETSEEASDNGGIYHNPLLGF